MSSSLSDIELWNAAADGNRDAYSELFRRFYPRLHQYGMKIAADAEVVEDAIQELFLDLWQKPTAQPLQSVQAYLLQAVKFKLYKHFRRQKQTSAGTFDEDRLFELSPETLQISREEADERRQKIYAALAGLSPRQREIIYLKIYKGLSYEEVSEVMGMNYQVVRNLLYTALKAFKKLYPVSYSFLTALIFSLCV